jgi:hypothetical protein
MKYLYFYHNKNIYVFAIVIYFFISVLGLSGCATVTMGTIQTITIKTVPSGAKCTISREGKPLSIIFPTPGTVYKEKSSNSISVLCEKKDYLSKGGTIPAKFQEMTFGNILVGGLIGLATDAITGSINKYDPILTIILIPEEFNSAEERDTFFDKLKSDVLAEFQKNIDRIYRTCAKNDINSGDSYNSLDNCEDQIKVLESAKEGRLIQIEKEREIVKVRKYMAPNDH